MRPIEMIESNDCLIVSSIASQTELFWSRVLKALALVEWLMNNVCLCADSEH